MCHPGFSRAFVARSALFVLQATKSVMETWERGQTHNGTYSLPPSFAWYERTRYIRIHHPKKVYLCPRIYLPSSWYIRKQASLRVRKGNWKRMHALTPLVLVLAAASTLASPGRPSCGPPKIPPHGSVKGGARSFYDLGGYVQYACDKGYQIQRPNVAVCIYKDGGPAWNNPPPQCTRKI